MAACTGSDFSWILEQMSESSPFSLRLDAIEIEGSIKSLEGTICSTMSLNILLYVMGSE